MAVWKHIKLRSNAIDARAMVTWPGHLKGRLGVGTVPASTNDGSVPRTWLRVVSIVMDHILLGAKNLRQVVFIATLKPDPKPLNKRAQ